MKLLVLCLCLIASSLCFKKGEEVRIFVNKISPYANPTESYRYYDLPYCQPTDPYEEPQSIGEKLSGNRKMSSVYKVEYRNNIVREDVCTVTLKDEQIRKFKDSVDQNYIFEMFVEDFAVGNVVGFIKNDVHYLVRHLNFNIYYNKKSGNIVKANIDFDQRRDVVNITSEKEREIKFSYSVFWRESNATSSEINTGNDSYFADEIHWFSFLNAFFLVTFLVILVWMILQRISKTEMGSGTAPSDLESDKKDDDMLWKLIRVEVFKCPSSRHLLAASVGSGFQLVLMILILFIFGVLGMYYQHKGSILTASILLYSLTAFIAGAISARFYKYLGGTSWHTNVILTSILFPLPLFTVAMLLNNFAWAANSTAALPFSSVIFVIFMWAIVTLPLTLFGAISGRMKMDETLVDVGEKVPKMSRPIPKLPFYHSPMFTIFIAGLLPFSAMHVELYYIFSSIWGHKVYTMYGMIFMVFVMVLNMTSCISIVLTYFQLNSLDYRWWWRSFFYGGSSGVFVFLYAIYFYLEKTEMFGFLQVSYYFGYSALFSLAIFLMLGSVGFLSSMAFVQHIYERSKID